MNGLLAKLMDWPSVQAAALMMPFHEPADLDAAPTELFKSVHGSNARFSNVEAANDLNPALRIPGVAELFQLGGE